MLFPDVAEFIDLCPQCGPSLFCVMSVEQMQCPGHHCTGHPAPGQYSSTAAPVLASHGSDTLPLLASTAQGEAFSRRIVRCLKAELTASPTILSPATSEKYLRKNISGQRS